MTEAETQEALKGRTTRSIREDKHEQPLNPPGAYAPIQVTDVKVEVLSGSANLIFSEQTKRLIEVYVSFKLDQSDSPTSRAGYATSLQDSLTKKYGKPLLDYHCDATGIVCTATWQTAEQEIELRAIRSGLPPRQAPMMIGISYALPKKTDL
jgi:hypothetical protein